MSDANELLAKLTAPFDPGEVKFRPATVSGTRALALAYVDARVIQDRLDQVLGPCNWQTKHEALPDGSVICTLSLRLNNEWISKSDIGGQSEQPDGGDRMKAAFSDSLKRAAVNFGIGRYLYRLPQQWADYDPQRRQFINKPQLPAEFRPVPAKPQGTPNAKTQGKAAAPTKAEAPAAKPQAAAPAAAGEKQGPFIDRQQAKELWDLCIQARITNGQGQADVSGIFACFKISALGELTVKEWSDAKRMVKIRDPLIMPESKTPTKERQPGEEG